MSLRPVYGHVRLRERLATALAAERLPQALLLTGPRGVGKQRIALWIAQALLCQEPKEGAPCDACRACRQVVHLGHPDLLWLVPVPRPDASDPEKAVRQAEEALGEVWGERRETGAWGPPERMAGHHLASVRLLVRRLHIKPALGARKVFVVGDAERLVPQEQNPEAANALLKGLEEPPADTTVILTASDPHALLPTLRSRLVAVRVGRLTDAEVADFLARELSPPPTGEALKTRVAAAEGIVGNALTASDGGVGRAGGERLARLVREGIGSRAAAVLAQPPWSARGDFTASLDGLAWLLRDRARAEVSEGNPAAPQTVAALDAVLEARRVAQGNVNPQLLLAALLDRLSEAS